MARLEPKHYALAVALLIGIGTQLAGSASWDAVKTPMFLGGILVQIGTTVAAIFTGAPQKPWDGTDRRS